MERRSGEGVESGVGVVEKYRLSGDTEISCDTDNCS